MLKVKLKSVKSYSALNRWKSSVTGWRICALTEDTGQSGPNFNTIISPHIVGSKLEILIQSKKVASVNRYLLILTKNVTFVQKEVVVFLILFR